MRVTNQTRWKRVEGVHIILRHIEPPEGNKEPFQTMWCNAAHRLALVFRHSAVRIVLTMNLPQRLDSRLRHC